MCRNTMEGCKTTGVKRGNLEHGVLQDGESTAVSTTRYIHTKFLVSVVSMNWEFSSYCSKRG